MVLPSASRSILTSLRNSLPNLHAAGRTFESGQLAFTRYRHLLDDHNIPFVRASGAPRVVDSAGNWSAGVCFAPPPKLCYIRAYLYLTLFPSPGPPGFAAASRQRYQPYVNVVLPESANSTLKQDCPRAASGSAQMNSDTWLAVFAPRLLERLSKAAPGVELDAGMVFSLMAVCPFESVAKLELEPEPGRGGSRFCALFDEEDWRDFEYHADVEKYYKDGCVSPLLFLPL